MKQRLLVGIRGKEEAMAALIGGAHIVNVEFPISALGTPYPIINIRIIRNAVPQNIAFATNIG